MTINIDDASSWGRLPAELQTLLSDVQLRAFPYRDRADSLRQTQLYLENGNFFMAKSVLEKILERQDNLRQGLTPELEQLILAVQAGELDYPERADSWQQTQLYLENGNFFMAKSVLEKIMERQDNLRQGLTPELQLLIQAVQAGELDYPERADSLRQTQLYLGNGNFFMAKSVLEKILERQDNQRQGLTPELEQLIQAVQADVLDYPERADSWQQTQLYLENGNFFMAKSVLEKIMERQDNLRQGLTPELEQLMQAVQADVLDYPERADSWQQTQLYLENGNFFMAKSVLEKILERQDNLRQ